MVIWKALIYCQVLKKKIRGRIECYYISVLKEENKKWVKEYILVRTYNMH